MPRITEKVGSTLLILSFYYILNFEVDEDTDIGTYFSDRKWKYLLTQKREIG